MANIVEMASKTLIAGGVLGAPLGAGALFQALAIKNAGEDAMNLLGWQVTPAELVDFGGETFMLSCMAVFVGVIGAMAAARH